MIELANALDRLLQFRLAPVTHRARKIEADARQRRPPQRLLIDRQCLFDDRALGRPDGTDTPARVEVPSWFRRAPDIGHRHPPARRRDPLLDVPAREERLQIDEELFGFGIAGAVDEAERRVGNGDTVGRIDRVQQFLAG